MNAPALAARDRDEAAGAEVRLGSTTTASIPHRAPHAPDEWPVAWRQAGEEFGRRLDAARATHLRLRPGSPDLDLLNSIVLDDVHLQHVLRQLGFSAVRDEIEMMEMEPETRVKHPRLRSRAEWWPDAFGPVLIAFGDGVGHVAVDIGSGAWRALPLGGERGADIIALAAYRLGLTRWKSAVWLARACGLEHIPEHPRR